MGEHSEKFNKEKNIKKGQTELKNSITEIKTCQTKSRVD